MSTPTSTRLVADAPEVPRAELGVIGGSGLYTFLHDATEVRAHTPYGEPSAPLVVGQLNGRSVAFLPRHGRAHEYPPHRINYRANLWALRALGVRQVLGPCAVGSLRSELGPGTLVLPDQLVDRTTSRIQTYFDDGGAHVGFADPYCPAGRAVVHRAAAAADWEPVDGATMVVIEGPRFSTRAESQWYAAQGWSLVNMTGHPEAVLARELGLCYTALCLVTDLDAGVAEGEGVTQAEVFELFAKHLAQLRELLGSALTALPSKRSCPCTGVHEGMSLPVELPDQP